jgi:hypothetical protein
MTDKAEYFAVEERKLSESAMTFLRSFIPKTEEKLTLDEK